MPAFLATRPAPPAARRRRCPRQCARRDAAAGGDRAGAPRAPSVPVDARVARGRTYRHALERLLEEEPVDRVIVSATGNPRDGLTGDDLVWLLERAPAEVLILRPASPTT